MFVRDHHGVRVAHPLLPLHGDGGMHDALGEAEAAVLAVADPGHVPVGDRDPDMRYLGIFVFLCASPSCHLLSRGQRGHPR